MSYDGSVIGAPLNAILVARVCPLVLVEMQANRMGRLHEWATKVRPAQWAGPSATSTRTLADIGSSEL